MIVRKSLLLFGIALLLATPVSASFGKVQAITANDWKAGRIIDDNIFTNANDMSVADIQAFLNSKVPVCDSNGQKSVGYYYNASTGQPKFSWFSGGAWVTTTRAVFAQRYSAYYQTNISNLPLTCLKNYYEVPKTAPGPGLPASNAFGAPIPTGAVSAAQMIYNASIKYRINPKVLLVKLHTESAGPLTTDDWPFQNQYLYAMGAQCPDSGPGGSANCNSNYAGFSIQIDEAAALLRWYLDSMTQSWWQYKKPYQVNSILWNVAPTGCGAGNVYIESKATAALYTYTPYQPNAAALANMYGTGDGCSAYGNRNFWRVYSDWFGATTGPEYQATLDTKLLYTDASYSNRLADWHDDYFMTPGQKAYVRVTMLNTGHATWSNSNTRLGTFRPLDYSSMFKNESWYSHNRIVAMNEALVPPGQRATFDFSITAPEQYGNYLEAYAVITEGIAWMPTTPAYFPITVMAPSQNNYPDTGVFQRGDLLLRGEVKFSPQRATALRLQPNGNLELYINFQKAWQSNTASSGADSLKFQSDGNLVLLRGETPVWSSGTAGTNSSSLVVQNDGNVVLYGPTGATWGTSTTSLDQRLMVNQKVGSGGVMFPGQQVTTPDRTHTLLLQPDGNLVLYSSSRPIWSSGTYGQTPGALVVQNDGNIVLYNQSGAPIWSSKTYGKHFPVLVAQQDGNYVGYSFGQPFWSTGTNGR